MSIPHLKQIKINFRKFNLHSDLDVVRPEEQSPTLMAKLAQMEARMQRIELNEITIACRYLDRISSRKVDLRHTHS